MSLINIRRIPAIARIPLAIFAVIIILCAAAYAFMAFRYPDDDGVIGKASSCQADYTDLPIVERLTDNRSAIISPEPSKNFRDKIGMIRKTGYCIDFPYQSSPGVIRFASGKIGSYLDEKKSFAIEKGGSLKIRTSLPADATLDFSALADSFDRTGGNLSVYWIGSDGRNDLLRTDIKSYDRNRFSASAVPADRSFSAISAETGWSRCHAPFDSGSSTGTLVFENISSGDTILFIGNPVIRGKTSARRYNVIHIIFDAMSQKYMGIYNRDSNLTPEFDALENEFTVFDRMYTLGTKTRISVAGFLTSTLPPQTGHGYNFNLIPDEVRNRFYRDATISSLPRVLGANGYLTFQVGNCGFTNPALPTAVDYGFDESFEFQKYPYDSTGIAFHLIRTLRAHKGTPFYCYAHLNTTHKPRITPAKYYFNGYLANPSLMWRPNVTGATRYADHLFKLIVDSLKKEGLWDNSIVIISSDHGTLYEIDNYNRNFLLEDFSKIPFLIHIPDSLKKSLGNTRPRVTESTTLLNLAPTILDLLGIRTAPEFKGRSVGGLLAKKDPRGYTDENIFVYDTFAMTAIHQGRWKYTLLEYDNPEGDEFRVKSHHFFGSGMSDCRESLSDITIDPFEKTNLISVNKDMTSYMRQLIASTPYHPYMYVLSLYNMNKSDSIKAEITVRNGSINHADANNVPLKINGGTITHVFSGKGTSRITFGADRNDAVVSIRITLNGKTLPPDSFLSGEYALPLSGNPAVFSSASDRFALMSNGLYSTEALSSRLKSSCAVIVMKDYRRWIREAGKGADNGANTNMKQVLKSWGYIQ